MRLLSQALMEAKVAAEIGAAHGERVAVQPESLDLATRRMAEVSAAWDSRLGRIKRLAESAAVEPGGSH